MNGELADETRVIFARTHPGPRPPLAKGVSRSAGVGWLAIALLLFAAGPLRGHDIYTSLAEAKLLPDKLEITLTLARASAHDLLPNPRALPPITPETFPDVEPHLRAAAPRLIEITSGGIPLAFTTATKIDLHGDADVVFVLAYARPKASPVRFFARYLGHLVDGHIGTLLFTDARGADFGWAPVSIDGPTFEAPLPAVAAGFVSRPPAPTTMRVMSYNIHHGEGLDKKVELERIAKLIVEQQADLVALQEVDRGVERTAQRDLPAELAKLTGMAVSFERNIIYQGGDYGNAILTRFPIKSSKNTHYKMLRAGEQRGVLQLVLDVRGRDVLVMNTHLDHRPDDSERLINVDELRAIVEAARPMPVILCGDFNATPGSRTIAKLNGFLTDAWEVVGPGPGLTFPVLQPAKRLDYIWISRDSIEPLEVAVLYSEASDHLPVIAELRLK